MLSYLQSKLLPIRDVKSFEDWTSNQFGKKLYSIFFKTYTEKVWGMPCNEMSADWAAQRIKGLSLWGAVTDGLKRSLGLNKRPNDGQAVKTLLETFRYPRLGPGMMWEAARDKVVARGGEVLMGHALKQLASDGQGGWRLTASGPETDVAQVGRLAYDVADGQARHVPLLAIHGRHDDVVTPRHALSMARQFLARNGVEVPDGSDTSLPDPDHARQESPVRGRGFQVREWERDGTLAVRLVEIDDLGHAWSGGDGRFAFHEAGGPDATAMIGAFLEQVWPAQ